MPPVVRQLAEWCAGVQGADIPNATAELLPLRLLDTTGLIFAGTATPAVAAARSLVETLGGAPQSTMSGSIDRVPAAAAALVHGVAAHCFDFDDTIEESVVRAVWSFRPSSLSRKPGTPQTQIFARRLLSATKWPHGLGR